MESHAEETVNNGAANTCSGDVLKEEKAEEKTTCSSFAVGVQKSSYSLSLFFVSLGCF